MRDVLVVGAGIGGLGAALAMSQLGLRVRVVEQSASLAASSVGIVLHPNGMDALHVLGVDDQILAAGRAIRQIEIERAGGRLVLPMAEVWPETDLPTTAIWRWALHRILRDAVSAAGIDVHVGRRVTAIGAHEAGAIVTFEAEARERYDLVVAADGVRSIARRALGLEDAESTGLLYFRFPAANAIGLASDTWRTIERPDGMTFGFIPVTESHVHCFVQAGAADVSLAGSGDDDDVFMRRFGGCDPDLDRCWQARCGSLHVDVGHMVPRVEWGRDACVLLGDAAHALSPTFSEGGSLALEDAVVLGVALKTFGAIPEALAHFRAARAERVVWAHRMARSQVNARRRERTGVQLDAAIATSHLREMYRRLRQPLLTSSLAARLPLVRREPNPSLTT